MARIKCRVLAAGAILAIVTACTPERSLVPLTIAEQVKPPCQAGFCGGGDPNPTAIGIYIASTITESAFFGDALTDTDGDGLADICEENIAATFNPELRYCSCDVTWGHEPVYVVKPATYGDGKRVVRIMYMPSYYADGGVDNWGGAHPGDSEAIVLDVRYDPDTEHWILNAAMLSQHIAYFWYLAGSGSNEDGEHVWWETWNTAGLDINWHVTDGLYPDQFDYVNGHGGGVPIVWVAPNKHANYPSAAACDDGGGLAGFGEDNCQGNSLFAYMSLSDGTNGARNLGSSASKRLNCIASYSPPIELNHHPECFSTDPKFTGWSGLANGATPYSLRLSVWNF